MDILGFTERPVTAQITILVLGTVLDNNNAEAVVHSIVQARNRGISHMIIDCGRLEFISSAGVGAILGTIDSYRERGGDIVLCNVSPTIQHVLRVLDLLEFLTLAANQEAAVQLCNRIV